MYEKYLKKYWDNGIKEKKYLRFTNNEKNLHGSQLILLISY